jgi:hypothetical protein
VTEAKGRETGWTLGGEIEAIWGGGGDKDDYEDSAENWEVVLALPGRSEVKVVGLDSLDGTSSGSGLVVSN